MNDLYNVEYEQLFLSQLMNDPSVIDKYVGRLKRDDFVVSENKEIFESIIRLYKEGYKPDSGVISSDLMKNNKRDLVSSVMQISIMTSGSANIDYYFKELTGMSFKRRMKSVLLKSANMLGDQSKTAFDIYEELVRDLESASNDSTYTEYHPLKKYLVEALEDIEEENANHGILPGITPRLSELRDKLGSFGNGEYIIIGARTSIGKTVFAVNNLIYDAIVYDGKKAGLFTLEMSGRRLGRRLLQAGSGVDTSARGVCGQLNTRFFDKLMMAGDKLAGEDRLFIDDCEFGLTVSQFQAVSRRMVKKEGCEMIVLDYIGLMDSEDQKLPRHEQISRISRACKRLARELNIPLFVLSQLTRGAEGEKPTLKDLRESGSLEQDADSVILLHRDRDSKRTEIIQAKSRNGSCFTAHADFNFDRLRFEDEGSGND